MVVTGEFDHIGSFAREGFARITPDHQVDLAFPDVNGRGITSLADDGDGGILVGGLLPTEFGRQGVARLGPDGAVDPDFANPQIVGAVEVVRALPDGRVVVGGSFTEVAGQPRHGLAVLHGDGSLDTSVPDVVIGGGPVRDVHLTVDGLIVAGGFLTAGGTSHPAGLRLLADGSVDPSFTSPVIGPAFALRYVRDVDVAADGRIALGGNFDTVDEEDRDGVVAPDGGFVVAGYDGSGGGRMGISRVGPSGIVDTGFGAEGTRTVDFGAAEDAAWDVALHPDGRIVVAGYADDLGQVALARLDPDGAFDVQFDQDGHRVDNLSLGVDVGFALTLQADGRILVAGGTGATNASVFVARYQAAGPPIRPGAAGSRSRRVPIPVIPPVHTAGMALAVVAALLLVLVTAAVVAFVVRAVLDRQAAASRDATVRAAVDTVYALAGDKLGDQLAAGSREIDHTGQVISRQVEGMSIELAQVRELVAALRQERADQQGRLEAQLEEAARRSADLADVTGSLRQALASPQSRGQWGERMADDVLRRAGFVEGVSYTKRRANEAGTIPDFTFLLPDGDRLHMDVKFPASAYLRYLEAESDTDREQHRRQFLRDVRDRVKELTVRDYADPRTTPGYLLLFIPNEAVYSFVHEQDPDLLDHALERRVVLCSPSTLFAVLAVVRQAIDHFRLEQASNEILECLGTFTRQWEKFSDQLDKVGRQLDGSQKAFAELAGTRRNQLQRAVDAVVDLRERQGLDELGGGTGGGAGPAAGVPHLHEVRGA